MTTNNKRNWLTALAALSLAACTADVLEPGAEVGVLELPLVSGSADGTPYMLAATFDLVGPETIHAVADPTQPDWSDDILVLSPRVGNYQLTISGWTIYQLSVDPMGNINGSTALNTASLLSPAVQTIGIANNQTTSVNYQFSVPGTGVINFARGTLIIDFAVQQGVPDGSACSDDSVCQSHVCAGGVCSAASCSDGVQNGGESSPDCGGGCACAVDCSMCPAGTSCLTLADGTIQCAPLTACNATDAAACPNPATCVVDLNGMIDCAGGGTSGCSATQAAACPDPATCFLDPMGMVNCGGGGTTACTPAQAAVCPDPASCFVDANGAPTCGGGGMTCADCPAGTTCQTQADGTIQCIQPVDPNLACIKINEVQTQGQNGASDEFVELYNGCPLNVDLLGARLVYRSATGVNDTQQRTFTSSLILAGGGYLVLASSQSSILHIESLAGGLAAAGGGLALRHPDMTVIDSVGYGTATNAFVEGTAALAPANGSTLARIPDGSDTNNNSVDFQARSSSGGQPNF